MLNKYFFGLILTGLITSCNQTERTETSLPDHEVGCCESTSSNLYYKASGEATTAIGQIFIPPEGHPYLIKVSFYCKSSSNISDRNVKLRLSSWEADRPSVDTLWESEPIQVKKEFDNGWISFTPPQIKLSENQQYIAWLSMSGLENADNAVLSVFLMGPRGGPGRWTADYPKGMRTYWRQGNPDGLVDFMTQTPWKTDESGENLHFKMVFENKQIRTTDSFIGKIESWISP
jgi:hypothetical protein